MPMIQYEPNAGENRGRLPNAANPYLIGGVRFMPGTNQISEAQWRSLNDHPAYSKAIATRLEMGKLRVIAAPKKDAEPSITDFNLSEAKAMILNCHDIDLLKRWQGEDDRKGSQNAIAAQLEKLLPKVESERDTPTTTTTPDLDTPVFA